MSAPFTIDVSYSQIAVFPANLAQPFNDWTTEHVQQGFAWRREAVSFKTLRESGMVEVFWDVKAAVNLRPDSIRAIGVPFLVPAEGLIEIASITDGHQIQLVGGHYSLVFETGINRSGTMWCHFLFVTASASKAEILRADTDLKAPPILLMEAVPA